MADAVSHAPPASSTSNGGDNKQRGSSFSLNYFDHDEELDDTLDQPNTTNTANTTNITKHTSPEDNDNRSTQSPSPSIAQDPQSPIEQQPLHTQQEDSDITQQTQDEQQQEGGEQDQQQQQQQSEAIEDTPPTPQPAEDLKCFFTHDSFPVLKQKALQGDLHNTNMRGITWRVLLGVISPDTSLWATQLQQHRINFLKLKEQHVIDPHKAASVMDNQPDKFNPLSQDEENPWNQYFQDAELQKEITHDVLRTYQGNPFFDKPETKETLTQLLFLYAKEHSATRYIQGMNELLAPILFVLTSEKVKCTESPSIFDIVHNEQYVIHDTYTLFSHLLEIVGRWFTPLRTGNSPKMSSKKDVLLDDKLFFKSGQADESTNLQIVQQCRHIHYNLLNEVEPHLSRVMRDLQIEPHLYMLRWVRILLTQVFPLQDVLIIWDAIFAFGNNAVLLDWLCVAMLVNIRHLILGQDYSRCMQLLFNYPQDQDINALVASALKLYQKYQQQRQISPPKTVPSSKPTANTVTTKPSQPTQSVPPARPSLPQAKAQVAAKPPPVMRERAPTPPNAPQYLPVFQEPAPIRTATPSSSQKGPQKSILQFIFSDSPEAQTPSSGLPMVNEEAQTLRNIAAHMANRLERVLFLLNSLQSTPENEETLKLAVEEVTQVKLTLSEASEKVRPPTNEDSNTNDNNTDPTTSQNSTTATNNNNTNSNNNNTNSNNNNTNSNNINSNNNNNPLSAQQDTPTQSEINPSRTSPTPQSALYEKILNIDPRNIFRRK